jgi:hypothetical protein
MIFPVYFRFIEILKENIEKYKIQKKNFAN